jgi:hypothetical protein
MRTIIAILVLTAACKSSGGIHAGRGVPPASKNLLLRLERTLCFGSCPDYVVEVDSDGALRYQGNLYVLTAGKSSGHLAPTTIAELRDAIDNAHFADTPVKCCDCLDSTDAPSAMITVADGRPPKTIDDYHGCEATPKSIRELEDAIDRIIGIEKWIGKREERQNCFPGSTACPTSR